MICRLYAAAPRASVRGGIVISVECGKNWGLIFLGAYVIIK